MAIALTSDQINDGLRGVVADTATQYLSVVPTTIQATARINQVSFARPMATITIDTVSGNWADVTPYQTVWIGTTAGARDIGVFILRAAPTSTALYIQELALGDVGFLAVSELTAWADNAYVSVLADYPASIFAPRITYSGMGSTGQFYKKYDVAYSDQNESGGGVPGIFRIGNHRAGWVSAATDDAFETTFNLSATALNSGDAIDTILWDISGGTLESGSLSGLTVTVRYPYGHYIITCTVTLDNGYSQTLYRHVFAHDPILYPPIAIERITSDRQTETGRRMVVELPDPLTGYGITDGVMVVVWEETTWGEPIADAPAVMVGWADVYSGASAPEAIGNTLDIVGPLERLTQMRSYAQELNAAANPSHWQECSPALCNVDFFLAYMLIWHTTLTELFDVYLPGFSAFTTNVLAVSGTDMASQLNEIGQRVNVVVACESGGAIRFNQVLHQRGSGARDALAERLTLTETDFTRISYDKALFPRVGKVEADGFYYVAGTAIGLEAFAPGTTAALGLTTEQLRGQLITGQADLNTRAAHHLAWLNNPYPRITVEMGRNYHVLDVADICWVRLTVGAAYWPERVAFNSRCRVVELSNSYGPNGTKETTLVLEAETDGAAIPAETIPQVGTQVDTTAIDVPIIDTETGDIIIPYDPFDPQLTPTLPTPLSTDTADKVLIVAWAAAAGAKTLSTTYHWAEIFNESGEVLAQLLFNPHSPRLTTHKKDGALACYALTDAALYYATNILVATPTWDLQQSLADYTLMRAVRGVRGGIGIYGPYVTTVAGDRYLTFDAGTDLSYTITRGVVAAGGRSGNAMYGTSLSGAIRTEFRVDLGASGTLTAITFWVYVVYAQPVHTVTLDLTGLQSNGTTQTGSAVGQHPTTTDSAWTQITYSGLSWANTRYVNIALQDPTFWLSDIRVDDLAFSTNIVATEAGVWFSDDNGDTGAVLAVGGTPAVGAYDVDDFGAGVHIASQGDALANTETYTGAFAVITGPSTPGTGVEFNLIRIPYRLITSNAYNNLATALRVVWGADGLVSGASLWYGLLNAQTNAMSSIVDVTPVVGADTYVMIGPNALEINAKRPTRWLAFALINGDTQVDLLRTDDAGDTWAVVQADLAGVWVRWVESRETEVYLGTDTGILYSNDAGDTVQDITANFTDLDDLPIVGVIT